MGDGGRMRLQMITASLRRRGVQFRARARAGAALPATPGPRDALSRVRPRHAFPLGQNPLSGKTPGRNLKQPL